MVLQNSKQPSRDQTAIHVGKNLNSGNTSEDQFYQSSEQFQNSQGNING